MDNDNRGTTSLTNMHLEMCNPIVYYAIVRDGVPEPIVKKKEKPYFRKFEKHHRR